MRESCRFSMAVHAMTVLAHRAREGHVGPMTSAEMADSINTNPVIVRRLLAALGQAGLVDTRPGNGGGAWLARDPSRITLDEVHRAVEPDGGLIAMHGNTNRDCPVGAAIGEVLSTAIQRAEAALHATLAGITLAEMVQATMKFCPEAAKARRAR
ncbi:MAG: transcriptional regulator [Rhodospirillales bacterium]|jgi:Rrf2 family protein|nr:transcriptional regulator [Rhodospirillales bacterium]